MLDAAGPEREDPIRHGAHQVGFFLTYRGLNKKVIQQVVTVAGHDRAMGSAISSLEFFPILGKPAPAEIAKLIRDRLNLGGIANLMIIDDDLINKIVLHIIIKAIDHFSGLVFVGFGQRVRIHDDKHGKGQGFHDVDGLLPKPFSTSNRLMSLTMPKERDFIFFRSGWPLVP